MQGHWSRDLDTFPSWNVSRLVCSPSLSSLYASRTSELTWRPRPLSSSWTLRLLWDPARRPASCTPPCWAHNPPRKVRPPPLKERRRAPVYGDRKSLLTPTSLSSLWQFRALPPNDWHSVRSTSSSKLASHSSGAHIRAGRTLCGIICRWTSASSSCPKGWAGRGKATTGPSIRAVSSCSRRARFVADPEASEGNVKPWSPCTGWWTASASAPPSSRRVLTFKLHPPLSPVTATATTWTWWAIQWPGVTTGWAAATTSPICPRAPAPRTWRAVLCRRTGSTDRTAAAAPCRPLRPWPARWTATPRTPVHPHTGRPPAGLPTSNSSLSLPAAPHHLVYIPACRLTPWSRAISTRTAERATAATYQVPQTHWWLRLRMTDPV